MASNQDEIHLEIQFYTRLKTEINYLFRTYIKPPSVLHIFHLINTNVLNQADLDRIRAVRAKDGDAEAAIMLLECLVVYKDWFPCLLKVLRHPDVKLTHVAEQFEDIHEKVHTEFFSKSSCRGNTVQQQISNDGSSEQDKWMRSTEWNDPLNTFTFGRSLTSKPTKLENDYPFMHGDGSSSRAEAPDLAEPELKGEQEKRTDAAKRSSRKAKSKSVHGPEYDFSFEETSTALKSLPGWHEETDERKIEEALRGLYHEDGHYILWFWARKKRPGVCVIFKKRIKTFIVHKRLSAAGESVEFYIDRKGASNPDLQRLLRHHIETGISDMPSRNETMALLHPVKELK